MSFMRFLFSLLTLAFISLSSLAVAQDSPSIDTRFASTSFYRAAAGTTGSLAIPGASVLGGVSGWRICNDGVPGASTWLDVGQNADPSNDGVRLAPGQCFQCMQCTASLLKAFYVEGQAAANGYSVNQFHQ